jgi:hypothetical protein
MILIKITFTQYIAMFATGMYSYHLKSVFRHKYLILDTYRPDVNVSKDVRIRSYITKPGVHSRTNLGISTLILMRSLSERAHVVLRKVLVKKSGPGSSVDIGTGYGLDGPGRFIAHVQTGPGAHPASCIMSTGSFPGVKRPGPGPDHPPPRSAEVKN